MKETKHELIGEPIETDKGRHQWARCTKSRHSQLVNLDAIEAESDKSKAVVHISREDARKYSPKEEYQIGDVIFHTVWDDVGIVRAKEVTSTGGKSIIVISSSSAQPPSTQQLRSNARGLSRKTRERATQRSSDALALVSACRRNSSSPPRSSNTGTFWGRATIKSQSCGISSSTSKAIWRM